MENLLPLVSALLALSVISERIAELLKHMLSNLPVFKWQPFGDYLSKYPPGSPQEIKRSFNILKINLFCGFLTAVAAHASLFDLLNKGQNQEQIFGWNGHSIENFPMGVSFFAGCFLTGCFISLGSKFWHDLLDILLQIKNIKREMAKDPSDLSIDSLPATEQYQILKSAVNENAAEWSGTIKNFQGVAIANKVKGPAGTDTQRLSLQFNVSRKEDGLHPAMKGRIPEAIFHMGYRIPTDVIEVGEIISAGDEKAQGGSSISRRGMGDDTGTLGLRVKRNNTWYGISCFHVLFPDKVENKIYEVADQQLVPNLSTQVVSPSSLDSTHPAVIGHASFGKLNSWLDVGFFETTKEQVSSGIQSLNAKEEIHDYVASDNGNLKVKFFGRTSPQVNEGTAGPVVALQDILYAGKYKKQLKELIQLNIKAKKGDSGSIVVTESGAILGMIIAVSETHNIAYAVPMRSIFNAYSFTF